jgi:hypothetical protein
MLDLCSGTSLRCLKHIAIGYRVVIDIVDERVGSTKVEMQ